ncbi:hypothetical protein GGTG_09828 [Gaeumannomyces tritici R3-111a-1]|uniref:Rhodopsin domain-containing protein n=1 Tax=Gaeumannomyces tritici (strain R3-111a-1) TaxID=644352 RepID=J3P8J4_GAET3|nr:hypothetical protein GGTG_09828 [Gaeumannomyces tritici R3-111a-1]EJT72977.1 hypothetical protein GGTG_09828 [Gaeumannomyces tritici R3-111a-1]
MGVTPIGIVGGEGHWLLALSWSVTGVAAVCFLLRLYTRLVVVKSYGWDDTIYNGSFVLLLACMIMVHISTLYGLGQDQQAIWDDSPDRLTKALLYLIIGQIFGVSTMGVAKVSLGLFLLRLVTARWHRVAIWTAIGVLFLVTGVTSFVFAFQCAPPAFLWDKTIEGGHCPVPITPFAVLLGATCVAADLFFAVFPWLFVWRLNRPLRERAVIAASMSLGLVAAACGVKRTIGLGGLASDNYTVDAIPTCGWSIAELAITLVCIAIPVCLPLWKHLFGSAPWKKRPSAGSERIGGGSSGPKLALRTFGGSPMAGSKPSKGSKGSGGRSRDRNVECDGDSERGLGEPEPEPGPGTDGLGDSSSVLENQPTDLEDGMPRKKS